MKIILRCTLILLLLTTFSFTNNSEKKPKPLTIVIDVSHGGEDSGNSHNMLLEKEIVHEIAKKMDVLNESNHIKLHFTRDSDKSMSLQERVIFINQLEPDAVLSLHLNGENNRNVSGLRVFYAERALNNKKAKELAELIAESFEKNGLYNSRSVGSAPFYILKHSKAPALLLELGNMDNPSDLQMVQNPAQQEAIAQSILDALERL